MKTRSMPNRATGLAIAVALFAASEAGAFNPQPDPPGRFGTVGIVAGQTLRINVANVDDPNTRSLGGPDTRVELTFVGSRGEPLSPSVERVLPPGSASFHDFSIPAGAGIDRKQIRAIVKVIDEANAQTAKDVAAKNSLGIVTTLEVFDNDSGKTAVFVGEPGS